MKHDKPAVGLWCAPCCILDVQQIENDDDLESLATFCDDNHTEDEPCNYNLIDFGFYDTREELVAAIEAVDGKAT